MCVCIIKLLVEPVADGQSIDRSAMYIVHSGKGAGSNQSVGSAVAFVLPVATRFLCSLFSLISEHLLAETSRRGPENGKCCRHGVRRAHSERQHALATFSDSQADLDERRKKN